MRPKTPSEIEAMRTSGHLLAAVLSKLEKDIRSGMTTEDLNQISKEELKGSGGTPAFLGYQGFPGALCVSINNEIVHGIPSGKRELKSGDIVGMDFGVNYEGMITDSAITVIVGKPKEERHVKLVRDTEQAMFEAIGAVKAGATTGDIGHAAEDVLKKGGYGIVRDLVGHGVGHELHEDPNIPNFGQPGKGFELKKGMTIAIEPMATLGGYHVFVDVDGWTVKTDDGSLAAHFEHTVLVTENGYEILTDRAN